MTPKQAAFVQEYLIDLNATQAAIRAGYSARTAEWQGPQLLGKTHVAEAIRLEMAQRSKRTEITSDRVLQELALIAFSDIRRIFGPDGSLRSVADLDEETARAVSSVEVVTRQVPGESRNTEAVHKIRLGDKIAALTLLGRHLAMWRDRVEISVDQDLATLLEAAGKRADSRTAGRANGG